MAGNLSIESCGELFAQTSKKASSNYGVGTDGRVGLYVEEKDRSWASSNRDNDNRAVTIEVANDGNESTGWHVSDAAMNSLIDLVADICLRNNIQKLVWSTNKNDRVNHLNGCNMTVHRDYTSKSCPGDYLYNNHQFIADKVNTILNNATKKTEEKSDGSTNNINQSSSSLGDSSSTEDSNTVDLTTTKTENNSNSNTKEAKSNEERAWTYLSLVFSPQATAGIMGNLYAESGLKSNNLQNSFNKSLGMSDEEYTKAVDNNDYKKEQFVNDKAGYGLAQWTYYSRKQGLYEFLKDNGLSIADLEGQLEYLTKELKTNYKSLYNYLLDAGSVEEASDKILTQFEKPADTSDTVKQKRRKYSLDFYNSLISKETISNDLVSSILVCENSSRQTEKVESASSDSQQTTQSQAQSLNDISGEQYSVDTNHYVRIKNDKTPVFKESSQTSDIITTVNKNGCYTVVEQINEFYKLKSGIGYIRIKDVYDDDNYKKQSNPYNKPKRTLKFGCKGEDVQWLKFELLQYGIGEFKHTNNCFYENTEEAVKKYQSLMGLTVDGIVGTNTQNSLLNDGF
jgi:peptidoglycan hydrolase-like protein with peptidoglycan-binding domain